MTSAYRRTVARLVDWRTGYANAQDASEREEREAFLMRHGYPLNLSEPKTFSEKLVWRKLYDRNPLLPVIVDKFAVRDYVRGVLGDRAASRLLVPLVASAVDPAQLPFDTFPAEYIVKANHGSGTNLIVRGDQRPEVAAIVEQCRQWLGRPYGLEHHEWAYQLVPRRIIVEQLLRRQDDRPPREYKFQMFDGKCVLIQALNSDAWYDGINHKDSQMPSLSYFTPEWTWLNVSWCFYFLDQEFPADPTLPRPERLAEMLSVAEALSKPFDYIRVDLYDTVDGIKFGELTPYHLTGHARITPTAFDVELGSHWRQRQPRLSDLLSHVA